MFVGLNIKAIATSNKPILGKAEPVYSPELMLSWTVLAIFLTTATTLLNNVNIITALYYQETDRSGA